MALREDLHALIALTRRRIPLYALDREFGGSQGRSGVLGLTARNQITIPMKTS